MKQTRIRKIPYLCLFMLLISLAISAQNENLVKGLVIDSKNNPVIGATVMLKGKPSIVTVTDTEGKFSLKIPEGAKTLTATFVGLIPQDVSIGKNNYVKVQLEEDNVQLNNVVVIGYGQQKKADLTSSISTLDPKEVLKAPVGITDALQGAIAGVNVSGGKIRIRGTGSITGSTDPLWVVDGIIGGSTPNEEDIESIQVLKDAASCAIYGVRGANGVILVTTKKGKEGKPKISFNTYAGTGTLTKKINMMNAYDYSTYVNELYYNSSDAASIANGTWNSIVPTHDSNPSSPLADTDWWKQYFDTSTFQKYDLSVSGANNLGNYRLGGTYSNNGTDLNTYQNHAENIYANVQGTKGRFTYGGRVLASYSRTSQSSGESLMNLLMTPSNLPVHNSDGSYYKTGVNGLDGNDLVNQSWYINNEKEHDYSVGGEGTIFGEFKIFDWLKYRLSYSHSFSGYNNTTFTPKYDLSSSTVQDYYKQSNTKGGGGHKVIESLLSYDKTFGKHSISGVLGITSESSDSWSTTITGRSDEQTTEGEQSLFSNSITVSSSQYNEAYYSYLGRLMYSYAGKYLFTANFRADESSKFAKGKRWGYFPSFSAGWRISEEPWMQRLTSSWLNNLKIRATLGWIGSASGVGDYDYQSVVDTNNRYYTLGSNQSNVSAPLPESIANSSLTWERTRDAGAGFDMDLLHNKLSIVFDYYNRDVTDMLLDVQLPKSSGTTNTVPMNVGSMTNWGVELSATYRDNIGGLKYTISPNFSLYRNKVTSLGDNTSLAGGSISTGANVTRTVVGRPVAQYWGYKTAGLFKTDEEAANYVNSKGARLQSSAKAGDLKYVDLNGDGQISDDDKTYLGSSIPKYSLGLNISLEYKGFDFSMLWQGDFGNKIYNNWKSQLMGGYCAKNQMTDMNNRFRATDVTFTTAGGEKVTLPANTTTSVPRAVLNDPNNNHVNASDYFIESGSYLRCNRITLGYTFSKKLLQKFHMDELRLYGGIRNPFTFTKYSMFDPQVPVDGSTLNRGVDGSYYYVSNTFYSQREPFIGLEVTF